MSGPKNESDILTGSSTPNRFLLVSLAVIQAIYKHCKLEGGGVCFFSKKNILIPNVAEKNFLILVEEKKII
jgi:hypothetical protein